MDYKSKRKDGGSHRKPISDTEPSKVFTIRVAESIHTTLKSIPLDYIRKILVKLAKKHK